MNVYYHYVKDHLGNICAVVNSAAERQSSSTFSNALNALIFDGFNQNAFNAVVSEFKTASNANAGGLYNNYPLVRSNQTLSLIKQFYPIYL